MHYRRTSLPCRAAVAALAGLALGLSACERETPTSAAIRTASMQLQSLSPGGVNPPSATYRAQVYDSVSKSMKEFAETGTKSQSATAAILLSQAQAGRAEGPAAETTDLQRECQNQITEIRALLGQWLAQSALGSAQGAYDPAKELADIDAQVKQREDERLDQQRAKAAVDKQVADIQTQAKGRTEAAKAKRQEAGSLRSQVPNQTAVQGEQTLRHAQEIGRQADALDVEAADLEAQAAKIDPQSGEIQLQIDRLGTQKELLAAARTAVLKREQDAKAAAADAHAGAAKVAKEISDRESKLAEKRSGELNKATDEAINGYEQASKSAKKAQSDSRSTAQLAYAAAQQSLGDMQWSKAQSLTEYADLLDALATAKPALPEASAYKTRGDEARAAAKTALEAATSAYKEADKSYQAGAGPANKERTDRINAALAKAVKITSGGAEDIRNPDAPKDETPAAPASAVSEGGTPQAAVDAILGAVRSGHATSALSYLHAADPKDQEIISQAAGLVDHAMALNDAVRAKFNKGMLDLAMTPPSGAPAGGPGAGMGAAMMPMVQQGLAQFNSMTSADFKIEITGDTATVTPPGGSKPLAMKKTDGQWKIEIPPMGAEMGANAEQAKTVISLADQVLVDVAAGVKRGDYATPQLLMTDLGGRVVNLMQELQKKGIQIPGMPGAAPGGG
jgi:hypothetical protein